MTATTAVETAATDAAPVATKQRPVKTFRVEDISASVWSRLVVKAEPMTFYSISFQRRYVSNGETKYSGFFNPSDLPKLAALCQQAEEFVTALRPDAA